MDDSSQREEKALRVEGRGCVFGGQEVFGYLPETETQVQFSVSTKSGELHIMKGSTLIDGIIRNLRDFSADSPSHGTSLFDVNTALRSAVDLLAAYIRRATDRFSMELQPGVLLTRGSAQGLQQVFINLILNSCQSLGSRDRAIAVSSRAGDSSATLRVIVHDEGSGMTPEILSRVREPFFTTRRGAGGSGLGLYVSQSIVTAHGGTLELSSQPGLGTDAVVTLPAEAQQ